MIEQYYKTSFSPQMRKVYNLLSTGGRYSVTDIVKQCDIGDPRSVIRDLISDGVKIDYVWRKSENHRYKLFFIKDGC
jgi:hypothetical protein